MMDRRHVRGITVLLLVAGFAAAVFPGVGPTTARAQIPEADSTDVWAKYFQDASDTPSSPHFWRTIGEITLLNAFVWSYNRYIRSPENGGKYGFQIGFNSWSENLENGFEWDDNNFSTNQFAHPFHGNLYFNAARSNGYNFWQSMPFAFAGSAQWEYFGEEHHPAINDWISTSVGGITLGESLYRLSNMVLDNKATGGERAWRELASAAFNPVRGFNRLVTGEAFEVHDNPEDRYPSKLQFAYDVGLRWSGEDKLWESDTTRVFMTFDWEYGDRFAEEDRAPFGFFDFYLQLNFKDKANLSFLQASGQLYAADFHRSEQTQYAFGVTQHFDYMNTYAYEFGGQSTSAGMFAKFDAGGRYRFEAGLDANLILLGGVASDYPNFSGREYDYGPGLGVRFRSKLLRDGRPLFTLEHDTFAIDTVNGLDSNHTVNVTRVQLDVPIRDFFGLGFDYWVFERDSKYHDPSLPDVYRRIPEFRASVKYSVY